MADATRSLKIVVEEERKGDGYTQAANDLDKLGTKVSETDHKTKQWAETQKTLQTEIEKSKTKIKELHQEVGKTGDTSLFGDIRREESKLKGFTKTLEALAPDVAQAGEKAGSSFVSGITGAFDGAGPEVKGALIGGLVAAAAAAAVPVGAAISGAIAGAIGTVGIAGGIFAASKDPVVRSAATQFGQDISREFFGSGSAFIEPIRRSLGLLDEDFKKLNLGKAFAPLADDTEQLANGVGRFATNIMPGLDRAFEHAGPFIHAISDGLGETGSALGQFTDDVSRNHGAVEGLRELFAGVDLTVRALGKVFEFLSFANDKVVKGWALMAHLAADVAGAVGLPADKMHALADAADRFTSDTGSGTVPAVKGLGDAFAGSATKVADLAAAINAVNDAQTKFLALNGSVDDAQLAVDKDFTALTDALKENGKAWDGLGAKAEANRQAFNSARGDLERLREANIANGMSVADADKIYNAGIQKLLEFAKAAGATKAELDALKGKYEIDITTIRTTIYQSVTANKNDKDTRFTARASGGPVMAGGAYLVGERGPELFVPPSNGRIIPNGVGTGSGATQPAVDVRVSLDPALTGRSGDIAAALMQLLRFEVRTGASGDANLAFGGKTTQALAAS